MPGARPLDRGAVERWVAEYERLWRTAGTDRLADLFADDASYRVSPWAAPVVGLDAIGALWDDEREGPDELFTMASEVVAVESGHDGSGTAVVRVEVDYEPPRRRWRDLWVVRLRSDGRCTAFEEWPFAPDQDDGHQPAPG